MCVGFGRRERITLGSRRRANVQSCRKTKRHFRKRVCVSFACGLMECALKFGDLKEGGSITWWARPS